MFAPAETVPGGFDPQTHTVANTMLACRDRLMPSYEGFVEHANKTAEAHDLVTELDKWVEDEIKEGLQHNGNVVVFGEELGYNPSTEESDYWLLDGIDGTAMFVRGLPFCTNMAARIVGGEVVAAVIYNFTNDTLYTAEKSKGAFKNGKAIKVSDRELNAAQVTFESRLKSQDEVETFLALRSIAHHVTYSASGFDFAMIAEGKMEAKITSNPWAQQWDSAPGTLLVQEAGGQVTNLGQATYNFQNPNYIAANQPVHLALTEGENAIPLTH